MFSALNIINVSLGTMYSGLLGAGSAGGPQILADHQLTLSQPGGGGGGGTTAKDLQNYMHLGTC